MEYLLLPLHKCPQHQFYLFWKKFVAILRGVHLVNGNEVEIQ